MSRYVRKTFLRLWEVRLQRTTSHIQPAVSKVARGAEDVKKQQEQIPLQKTIRILKRDKRTERNILPSISIKEVEPSTYENVGHQIKHHSYSYREHTSESQMLVRKGSKQMHTQSLHMLSWRSESQSCITQRKQSNYISEADSFHTDKRMPLNQILSALLSQRIKARHNASRTSTLKPVTGDCQRTATLAAHIQQAIHRHRR